MKYLKYVVFAIISLTIDIVCKFSLNWIVAAFADKDGNLPKILKWFQTFDATLDEGMYARRREIEFNWGNQWASYNPDPKTWFQRYKNRALWLFRNSGYGFDYWPLGIKFNPSDWKVVKYEVTADKTVFIAKSSNAFNLYYEGPLGVYKLGWKAWNVFNKETQVLDGKFGNDGRIPITFSPNPFKRKK